jgi:hypothetical protein
MIHILLSGVGAMTEWSDIVKLVVDRYALQLLQSKDEKSLT